MSLHNGFLKECSIIYVSFQEPFNAHEFVERLAWKVIGKKAKNSYENFDPWSLHSAFEDVIKNLEERNKQIEKNIEKLEQSCKDEEKKHWQRVADLQRRNQVKKSFLIRLTCNTSSLFIGKSFLLKLFCCGYVNMSNGPLPHMVKNRGK